MSKITNQTKEKTMNIDELTIGEAKELAALFGKTETNKHPFVGKHCVIRTYSAGVHLGTIKSVDGAQVIADDVRRLWKWEGAFTLNEVALNGVSNSSRIAVEVPTISLSDMVELIPTSEKARKSFEVCNEK
jgi:hypothetical protein